MSDNNKYIINIIGPTAVGKTGISIRLAQHFNAQIFSSDSRQIYKEMNIGTAKPSPAELNMAQHHFINHISIHETYSAGQYESEALTKLKEYYQKNNVAILVGGTGLYIDAVLTGLDHFPKIDNETDKKVDNLLKEKGLEFLVSELRVLDPSYAQNVDIKNSRRITRALKVIYGSGKKYSSFLNQTKAPRDFIVINILLERQRDNLYDRINKRVDVMMKEGQLLEAKSLYAVRKLRALQTVGYQEIFSYLDQKYDLEFCIEEIKKNSRHYAKRQITWFKKYEATKFHPNQYSQILNFVETKLINA